MPDDDVAVVQVQAQRECTFTWRVLKDEVRRLAKALSQFVVPGDCVAGYMSNSFAAVVAALATMAIGAVVGDPSVYYSLLFLVVFSRA